MLVDTLKTILASNISYYFKAQGFHWNIIGMDFPQYHEFLGDIYEDAESAVDTLAEYIRTLDEFAPTGLQRFLELTKISDQPKIPRAELMFRELVTDTETLLDLYTTLFDEATEAGEQGLANFAADRMSSHKKYLWQLRATLR